jgi:hypothetical protein
LALPGAGVQPLDELTASLARLARRSGIELPLVEPFWRGDPAARRQLGAMPEMRRQGRIADLGRGVVGDLAIAAGDIGLKAPRGICARRGGH